MLRVIIITSSLQQVKIYKREKKKETEVGRPFKLTARSHLQK
jgi:hypothetical protein